VGAKRYLHVSKEDEAYATKNPSVVLHELRVNLLNTYQFKAESGGRGSKAAAQELETFF